MLISDHAELGGTKILTWKWLQRRRRGIISHTNLFQQHWASAGEWSGCTHYNYLACLLFYKPITIVLSGSKPRMRWWCPCKIMSAGTGLGGTQAIREENATSHCQIYNSYCNCMKMLPSVWCSTNNAKKQSTILWFLHVKLVLVYVPVLIYFLTRSWQQNIDQRSHITNFQPIMLYVGFKNERFCLSPCCLVLSWCFDFLTKVCCVQVELF